MEKRSQSKGFTTNLKKYWFQIILTGFLLLVLSRKDFSFQINLNNPDGLEVPTASAIDSKPKPKELLTQKDEKNVKSDNGSGILDRFGLSFIGGGNASKTKSEYGSVAETAVELYINRFAQVAISERKKYGVPSSIILANAIFHSFAGTRDLAQGAYNHFAISCSEDWSGDRKTYQNKCYRHYENAWTSFRDHSLFVTSGKYSDMVQLGQTDYKSWAKELEKRGFSEFDDLAKNLTIIIEKYNLEQLDLQ